MRRVADAFRAPSLTPSREPRALAFARLFEAVHEGVYIGTLSAEQDETLAANPHLKLIFGHSQKTEETSIAPSAAGRLMDPTARSALLDRLRRDGSVTDYLLRLRRADNSA